MPRNQGTSRKGKPGLHDRNIGLGKSLLKLTNPSTKYIPKANGKNQRGDGGMYMNHNVQSIGIETDIVANPNSVLEYDNLNEYILHAELSKQQYHVEHEQMIMIDENTTKIPTSNNNDKTNNNDFIYYELSMPRRPKWNYHMKVEELERLENESFLLWRANIAKYEEQFNYERAVTPFEKNIEIWKQLWRVIERSNIVIYIVDARYPSFYISNDLYKYVVHEHKKYIILCINKSDYLTYKQRQVWYETLRQQGYDCILFFSAKLEQNILDDAAKQQRDHILYMEEQLKHKEQYDNEITKDDDDDDEDDDDDDNEDEDNENGNQNNQEKDIENIAVDDNGDNNDEDDNHDIVHGDDDRHPEAEYGSVALLSRTEFLDRILQYAKDKNIDVNNIRSNHTNDNNDDDTINHNNHTNHNNNRIQYGMVGFPNVGKSSVINVLMGNTKYNHEAIRVAVANRPGKTKHFQTLILSDTVMLIDCPGLVFPSFVNSTADLIIAGVYPIAHMRDYYPVIQLICSRISRIILETYYNIILPLPNMNINNNGSSTNNNIVPPTPDELLDTICYTRGIMACGSKGLPDYQRVSRMIIQDYTNGSLLYCHYPPNELESNILSIDNKNINETIDKNETNNIDKEWMISKEEYEQETIYTSLKYTKKLHDKFMMLQQKKNGNNTTTTTTTTSTSLPEQFILQKQLNDINTVPIDIDMLTLLDDGNNDDILLNKNKVVEQKQLEQSHKKHWNKKSNTKRTNKKQQMNHDPYGSSTTNIGIVINGRRNK